MSIGRGKKIAATSLLLASLAVSGCAASVGPSLQGRHHGRTSHKCALGHAQTMSVGRPRTGRPGVFLNPGQVGTRAQVPWSEIGPGWVLAEYSGTVTEASARPRTGLVTLYLIDPAGGQYVMHQWRGSAARTVGLAGWSDDTSRALIQSLAPNDKVLVQQLTLATGQLSAGFLLPSGSVLLGYAKAAGLGLVARVGPNVDVGAGPGKIVRYDLRGHVAAVLARSGNYGWEAQSPDGATVAVSGATGITLVRPADGAVVCQEPIPGAAAHGGCDPVRWWNARTVLAVCDGLWLVRLDGSKPVRLSPPRNGRGPDPAGDIGAWALPSGLYLQAAGACSAVFIVKQLRSGQVKDVNIPGTQGSDNVILGAIGPRLLVQAQTGCPGSESLLWFDPVTSGVAVVLPAPGDVQGVVGAIPYDGPAPRADA